VACIGDNCRIQAFTLIRYTSQTGEHV